MPYRVKQGDDIHSIANKLGFDSNALWSDSGNAELKENRKNPDILFPGDEVAIPEKQRKEESGSTDQRHRFRKHGVPVLLRVKLKKNGEPQEDVDYVLDLDGQLINGVASSDGLLEEKIKPNIRKARLILEEDGKQVIYKISLGSIDPIDTVSGAQARLKNLGYSPGPIDGKLGSRTKSALKAFQKENNLTVNDDLDAQTCNKLKEIYGA